MLAVKNDKFSNSKLIDCKQIMMSIKGIYHIQNEQQKRLRQPRVIAYRSMIFVYRNLNRVEQRKDVVRQGVFFKSPPEGGKIAALLWVFCAFSCFYSKTFNFQFNSSFLYLDWVITNDNISLCYSVCMLVSLVLPSWTPARVIIYWPICKVLALC